MEDNLINEYDKFLNEIVSLTFQEGKFLSEEGETDLTSKYLKLEKLIRETLILENGLRNRIKNEECKNYLIKDLQEIKKEKQIMSEEEKLEKRKEKRKHIVNEIFSTENTYLSVLNTLITSYKKPMENRKLIAPELIISIFSNVESIYLLHKIFIEELEPLVKNFNEESNLSPAFKNFNQSMKLYSEFINNYENSNTTLINLLQNDNQFVKINNQLFLTSGCNINLQALLITPVQRVPRYKMLLQDLVTNTEESHPDREGLQLAHDKVAELASWINEKKREFENKNRVLKINQSLLFDENIDNLSLESPRNKKKSFSLIAPHRKFVHDGKLIMKCHTKEGVKWNEKHIFVFNDSLLITSEKKKKNSFRYVVEGELISLSNVAIENVQDENEDLNNVFRIMESNGHKTFKKIAFSCSDYPSKEFWVNLLKEEIENLSKGLNLPENNTVSVTSNLAGNRGSRSITTVGEGKDIKNWFESRYRKSTTLSNSSTEDLSELSSDDSDSDFLSGKKLVSDGLILVRTPTKEGPRWLEKHIFLFNDSIMLTKHSKKKYYNIDFQKEGELISLAGTTVENVEDGHQPHNFAFKINHSNEFTLFAASSQVYKDEWMKLINKSIEKFSKSPPETRNSSIGGSGSQKAFPKRSTNGSRTRTLTSEDMNLKSFFEPPPPETLEKKEETKSEKVSTSPPSVGLRKWANKKQQSEEVFNNSSEGGNNSPNSPRLRKWSMSKGNSGVDVKSVIEQKYKGNK
eukprot:TRINITY_DN425_c0_g2_i1.p1 TRINITY_DN425_c0_g2~~TRINITY_DN425_c0_g2_i1.p1  ORF type:complete len:746 (-),score=202.22 TRINITY_DN425_c0_g2_i1:64-2301(-)